MSLLDQAETDFCGGSVGERVYCERLQRLGGYAFEKPSAELKPVIASAIPLGLFLLNTQHTYIHAVILLHLFLTFGPASGLQLGRCITLLEDPLSNRFSDISRPSRSLFSFMLPSGRASSFWEGPPPPPPPPQHHPPVMSYS